MEAKQPKSSLRSSWTMPSLHHPSHHLQLPLRHLCLVTRLLRIAIDPVVQRQGEPRLMPGQPAIGPSWLCLLLAEVQCSPVSRSTPDPPPPRRPLQIHPSPTDKNRHQILTVDRKGGSQPTFSQLDGDGDLPPDCPRCQRQIDSIAPENRIVSVL